jgi:hypothetical protein
MEHLTSNKFGTMHVIAELAVFSGMFYYFNKKINKLETENQHIKKTYVDTFEDVYKKIDLLKEGIIQLQTLQNSQPNQQSFHQSNHANKNQNTGQTKNIQVKSTHGDSKTTIQENVKETSKKQQSSSEKVNLLKIEVPVQLPSFERLQQDLNQSIASDLMEFLQGSTTSQMDSVNITNITDPSKVQVLDDSDDVNENNEHNDSINENSKEMNQKEASLNNEQKVGKGEKDENEENQTLSQTDFDEINKLLE